MLVGLGVCFSAKTTIAQTQHDFELWGGIIAPIRFSKRLSIWNDAHFVPQAFFATRHGLTYHFTERLSITGGYAWVPTATSFSSKLIRNEHRPWGQIECEFNLFRKVTYRLRFRYDGRFRNRIEDLTVLNDDYLFYSRLRLMHNFRFRLIELNPETQLHFNLLNETLFNVGKQTDLPFFDQHRVFGLIGVTRNYTTIQFGYHLRILPQNSAGFNRLNHGLTLWWIQLINIQKR